jgi:hypothetical protein
MVQLISTSEIYFSEIIKGLYIRYFQNFKKLIEIYISWLEYLQLIKKKKNLRRRMVPVCIRLYVCMCMYANTHLKLNQHVYTCTHVCMCFHTCTCVCVLEILRWGCRFNLRKMTIITYLRLLQRYSCVSISAFCIFLTTKNNFF